MIESRCRITKGCSFLTCRLYTVQICTVYLAFNPHGHMVVVSESLAKSAERYISLSHPPLYFIVNASITLYSASEVGKFQKRVQLVSIYHDILLSASCRVGLVQHLGLLDVNRQAELL